MESNNRMETEEGMEKRRKGITYICHNSQCWKMAITAVMAYIYVMAINMVFMGVFLKFSKNADQQRKWFLKICQNKFVTKLVAIHLVLWPHFGQIISQFVEGPNKVQM